MAIADLFVSATKTVDKIFNTGERHGFIIPLYQRPYSWDTENVDQLLDDIVTGLKYYLDEPDGQVHFLGTFITIENNSYKLLQNDLNVRKALPKTIEDIIDGQQRISTIAVIAIELHSRIKECLGSLTISEDDETSTLLDIIKDPATDYLKKLSGLFSYTVRHGAEDLRKPILIRDSDDKWIIQEDEALSNYRSSISNFIALYIREKSSRKINTDGTLGENLKSIREFLDEKANNVEEQETQGKFGEFPSSLEICKKIQHENIWGFDRSQELIKLIDGEYGSTVQYLIRLLAFSFFLLERCCFTHIQPRTESSAFDLFQSLNATGTPLTALETFKPDVVHAVEESQQDYKISSSHFYFTEVEEQFSQLTSAQSKNDRTNEFLLLFCQSCCGKKLRKHFSEQLKWLKKSFQEIATYDGKERFLHKMSSTSKYSRLFVYPGATSTIIKNFQKDIIDSHAHALSPQLVEESKIALSFIVDSKHKIAHSILNRLFYEFKVSDDSNLAEEFCKSTRLLAAYFIILRGLGKYPDSEYRKLMEKSFNWLEEKRDITFLELSKELRDTLAYYTFGEFSNEDFSDGKVWTPSQQEIWISKASSNITYGQNNSIVKLILLMAFNNTVPDETLGLMKPGKKGSTIKYLSYDAWNSRDLQTIEHICPQDMHQDWAKEIYEKRLQHQLGNLTLLPQEINSSLSNKPWLWKLIYYKFLATKDPDEHTSLMKFAEDNNVDLPNSTQKLLSNASFYSHIEPIARFSFSSTAQWNAYTIEERTTRILELAAKVLCDWLEGNSI